MAVVLLPVTSRVSCRDVEHCHPAAPLVACDFYVEGIEELGVEVPGGYQIGRITNVDHHAPTPRMRHPITSTKLAMERVRALGLSPQDTVVIINHTDCDSVLSAAIMSGDLPPDDDLGEAAIAADHTGAENPIADLLQGLNDDRDYDLSLRSLNSLRSGHHLETRAIAALDDRMRKRELAARHVGRFKTIGGVAWSVFEQNMDSEFFPALLPEAILILLAIRIDDDPARHIIRLRLGVTAPDGLAIDALGLTDFDRGYGGRWNAGANKRGGGTLRDPEDYANEVSRRLKAVLETEEQV